MRCILRSIPTTFALAALLAVAASAQSVSDIVEQMYDAYERQAAGIDNYTLVQSTMGFESTSYYEKQMVDGHPVFQLRQSGASAGGLNFGLGGDDTGAGDVYVFGPELIEYGRYEGRDQIDGISVHVLAIDDLSQLTMAQPPDAGDMEFEARNGRLFVDAELMVPRRLEFVGDAMTPDGSSEVTVTISLLDIRDVEGLLIPYRTSMQIGGLQAMIDPEMQAQLQEMERQLAALPADQRAMMERMMGAQLDQLRQMVAGGGDAMSVEVTVSEVRVNSGPPRE